MAKANNEDVKKRIKTITYDLILKHGLKGLNMIELAKQSGVAKATLYKIIGSKEDLIHNIACEIFARNIICIFEPVKTHDDPVVATVNFMDNYLNYGIASQRVLQQQIYLEYPAIESSIDEKYESEFNKIVSAYKNWQDKGLLNKDVDIEYAFEALTAINEFYVLSNYPENEVIERLRSAFKCFFNGMGIKI
ncbi:MAG: TetR/AcrR family transcriptional regulator [Marinifilaceae bacterium]|jgi:AcrR family transcriptional regulator|nr:TetR/AcrR family transcriptional regulator [Marinifilaceae bacterium]